MNDSFKLFLIFLLFSSSGISAKQDGKTCLVYVNLKLDISLMKGTQITHDFKMLSNTNI